MSSSLSVKVPARALSAQNHSEFLRARRVVRGDAESRRRESLATDSRVLRPATAVKAAFCGLRRKIILPRGIRRRDRVCACADSVIDVCEACTTMRNAQRRTAWKPAFYRHFCAAPKVLPARAAKNDSASCDLPRAPVAFASRRRGAALTHKIKLSHCYFFPAVVIGCQCTSIRDCTVPMSPSTQARRAAMAKKRKTKAAAKKAPKKTKRKKKK